jgi:hypothetical protein
MGPDPHGRGDGRAAAVRILLAAVATAALLTVSPVLLVLAAAALGPGALAAPAGVPGVPAGGSAHLRPAGPLVAPLPSPPHRPWATLPLPMAPLFASAPAAGFDTGGLPFGQCTWYAAWARDVVVHADGKDWVGDLARAGFATGGFPSVGAIVSWRGFAPGYGAHGHVAVVVAVDPDGGGFTVAEANVIGLGRADVRWIPIGDPGIVGFVS